MIWEFVVNLNAQLNLGIYYTMIGNFETAQQVLNPKWLLLYIPVYIFGLWNTRREAIDLNKYAILSDKSETASNMEVIKYSPLDSNFMSLRRPRLAVIWSMFIPGLGHLYLNRIPTAFYLVVWTVTVIYFSNLTPAVLHTFIGDFEKATTLLDPQWLLFLPSIYVFAMYDAYVHCKEYNKLYKSNQALYLKQNYQISQQKEKFSLLSKRNDQMNVICTFSHSLYLELALKELEEKGISKQDIFSFPLTEKASMKDNIKAVYGDGMNLFDGTFVSAMVFMLLGTIYGFIWTGGPIIWAIIGMLGGGALGLIIDLKLQKQKIKNNKKRGNVSEVIVVVYCQEDQVQKVKDIVLNHFSSGVSIVGP